MARLWTLLALVALILMPLAMAGGQAAAASLPASSATGHCDEHQEPADAPASAQLHCTGCAGLPAVEAPPPVADVPPDAPAPATLAETLSGTNPATDPPPPKSS